MRPPMARQHFTPLTPEEAQAAFLAAYRRPPKGAPISPERLAFSINGAAAAMHAMREVDYPLAQREQRAIADRIDSLACELNTALGLPAKIDATPHAPGSQAIKLLGPHIGPRDISMIGSRPAPPTPSGADIAETMEIVSFGLRALARWARAANRAADENGREPERNRPRDTATDAFLGGAARAFEAAGGRADTSSNAPCVAFVAAMLERVKGPPLSQDAVSSRLRSFGKRVSPP